MHNVFFLFCFKLQSKSCISAVIYFAISCINASAWMLLGKILISLKPAFKYVQAGKKIVRVSSQLLKNTFTFLLVGKETDLQLCTHTETNCSSPCASYRQTCKNLKVLYRSNIISTSTFSNYHCTLCFPSCVDLCTYVCLRVYRSSLCKNSRKMNLAPPLVFPGMADNFSAQLRRHAHLQAAVASLDLEYV